MLPEIAPELIGLIVTAAVPPYDLTALDRSHRPRYQILTSLSLVSSTFRHYAHPFLYEYVVLSNDQHAALIEGWAGSTDFPVIRSLRIDAGPGRASGRILEHGDELLARCSNLVNLLVRGVDLQIGVFEHLPKLTKMNLISSNIFAERFDPPQFQLAKLAHLDCHGVGFMRAASEHFLSPTFLPNVTAMSLHRISASDLQQLDSAFVTITPQLRCLSVDTPHVYENVLPTARSLLLLDMSSRWDMASACNSFMRSPRFLRIYHDLTRHYLERSMQEIVERRSGGQLQLLEEVLVDGLIDEGNAMMTSILLPALEELGVRYRRGHVLLGGGRGFFEAVNAVERILLKEKRVREDR